MTAMISAVFLLVLERTRLRRTTSGVFRAGFAIDVGLLVLGLLATALALPLVDVVLEILRATGLPRFEALDAPLWLSIAVSLVLLDFGNYVAHDCMHRFDVLWRYHRVHHSIPTLDWLATFRFHVAEIALRRLIAPVFFIIAGMPPAAIGSASGILLAWAMFNHSNLRLNLRVLEPVLITPRLHYVHHRSESAGRNLGTVFSVWDRIFGRLETHYGDV